MLQGKATNPSFSVHPEMAILSLQSLSGSQTPRAGPQFHNLCVNLRDYLCGVLQSATSQSINFIELIKNISFMNWKLARVQILNFFIFGKTLLGVSHKLFR
jgi:hypothetical protein